VFSFLIFEIAKRLVFRVFFKAGLLKNQKKTMGSPEFFFGCFFAF